MLSDKGIFSKGRMMKDYLDFSNIKIAVIGDCMLDIYHYGHINRISPEAPIPIFLLNNEEPEYRLGGACNTALNLSKLGVQTTLYGFLGNDMASSYMETYLSENNIENRLLRLRNFPTITKSRYFSHNQQVIRIDNENTDGEIYNQRVQNILIENVLGNMVDYDAIILSDYGKGTLYHPVLDTIINNCHEDLPIFVDPKINDWQFYKNAFCITPNWKEFKQACHAPKLDIDDLDAICQYGQNQCIKFNIEYILLTLGSEGMILIDKNAQCLVKSAQAKEVFDVSGAGDTVIATVAAAYCKEYPMSIAMQLAILAAKVVIGHLGTYAVTNSELQLELLNSKRLKTEVMNIKTKLKEGD
jgi:D-beta-D-heptose 7-phosphate kinase/D-beta-D-heptose 1-phosphate adenosyltransferase